MHELPQPRADGDGLHVERVRSRVPVTARACSEAMTLSFAGHLTLLSHFLDRQLENRRHDRKPPAERAGHGPFAHARSRVLRPDIERLLLRSGRTAARSVATEGATGGHSTSRMDSSPFSSTGTRIRSTRWSSLSGPTLLGEPSLAGQERPAGVCAKHLLRVHPAYARGSQPPDLG